MFLAHTRIVHRRLYYDYDWVEALNDAALAVAERSRTLYPESASSALMLGWVHLQAGNGPEAIDHLRRAAGPGPGPQLLGMLGRAYALAGDYATATDLLLNVPIGRSLEVTGFVNNSIHGLSLAQTRPEVKPVLQRSPTSARALRGAVRTITGPVAVRSSSSRQRRRTVEQAGFGSRRRID